MILLADSGSSKTHWALVENGVLVKNVFTSGINPFYQSQEQIAKEIKPILMTQLNLNPKEVEHVFYYGAGCVPDKIPLMEEVFKRFFSCRIDVNNDLLAACRALSGKNPGIVCILGTGSNSCFYDGHKVIQNVSPLGFILGDEGSGAALGKLLVADILKNQLPKSIIERFYARFDLTSEQIMDRIYRHPFPNRFLAGLSVFLKENIREDVMRLIVEKSFTAFFQRNILQYGRLDYPIHFSGSVAYYYQDILKDVTEDFNMQFGKVEQEPMNGLIEYHGTK